MKDAWEDVRVALAANLSLDLEAINRSAGRQTTDVTAEAIDTLIFGGTSIAEACPARLKPFEDFRFADIKSSGDIQIRRIEQNFEQCGVLVGICGQLEDRYRELAERYLEGRIRFEEFLAFDAVHRREVQAGVYDVTYREAKAEREALDKALVELESQKQNLDLTTADDGPLSKVGIAQIAGWSGTATGGGGHDSAVYLGERRARLEAQAIKNSALSVQAEILQLQGRRDATKERERYARLDIQFKAQRTAISRDLAYINFAELHQPASPVNYLEEMEQVRAQFRLNFSYLYSYAAAVRDGLSDMYGITMDFEDPKPGNALRMLSQWFDRARQAFFIKRQTEVIRQFAFRLESQAVADGEPFTISKSDTGGHHGRLRGIAFEHLTADAVEPLQLDVGPPQAGKRKSAALLRFARVGCPAGLGDPKPEFSDALWNLSPYGSWTVKAAAKVRKLQDVVLYLYVAT